MKGDKPSLTAEMNAVYWTVESMKPADERVCYDPFAINFVTPRFAVFVKNRLLRKIASSLYERIFPGDSGYVVARGRYIDDYLKECIDDGIEQLVILGAGYDTRAYRFRDLLKEINVFEVDHPTTQGRKIRKIKEIFGVLPDNVIYVTIDFAKEKLSEKLVESGYDKNLKTLFIWEGVTMYLSAEGVDETLSFIASNSGRESRVVFDYILNSVIKGTSELKGAKIQAISVARIGEPFIFGIENSEIESFLSKRGFYRLMDVGAKYLRETYFKGSNEFRKIEPFFRIVHAMVES